MEMQYSEPTMMMDTPEFCKDSVVNPNNGGPVSIPPKAVEGNQQSNTMYGG